MKIIITAAGLGSRFKKNGINNPKYKIIARKRSLYEWSMLSLKDFFHEEFIFIFRKEILDRTFIDDINIKLGINKYSIIEIDDLTDGQATTAFLADKCVDDNEEIVIYNIDTYLEPFQIKRSDIEQYMVGFIPVVKAKGDRWSFIKVNDSMRVIEVAEKRPISNLATIGFYYFKSWKIYKEIYSNNREEIIKNNREFYIAPMYEFLLEKEFVGAKILDKDKVYILGTPEEVEEFDEYYLENNI